MRVGRERLHLLLVHSRSVRQRQLARSLDCGLMLSAIERLRRAGSLLYRANLLLMQVDIVAWIVVLSIKIILKRNSRIVILIIIFFIHRGLPAPRVIGHVFLDQAVAITAETRTLPQKWRIARCIRRGIAWSQEDSVQETRRGSQLAQRHLKGPQGH